MDVRPCRWSKTVPLKGTLTQNGTDTEATTENVLPHSPEDFFWLDLDDERATARWRIAQRAFRVHPLAVAAAEKFKAATAFDDYDNFVYLVARALIDRQRQAEVHFFWTTATSSPCT